MPAGVAQSAWIAVLALCALAVPLSGSGAWIVLAPASVCGCYLAGRHLASTASGLIALASGAAGSALVLWVSARLSALGFLLNLVTVVVLFVFLPWFIGHSRRTAVLVRLRERERLDLQARQRERERQAAQMHDELGHDLALLALQASALQAAAEPGSPAVQQASAIHEQADAAIENLHQIIGVLRQPREPAALVPAGGDFRKLVAAARARGLRISVTGQRHLHSASVSEWCVDGMHQLVRETLANAARYAPRSEVHVTIEPVSEGLTIAVETQMPAERPPARDGATGLAQLRAYFESHQGTLSVRSSGDHFRVMAWMPLEASDTAHRPPAERLHPARPTRHAVLTVLVSLAIVAAVFTGFYALQNITYKATALSPASFGELDVGMERSEVERIVTAPGLETASPVIRVPEAPSGATCRFFAARTGPLDLSGEMFRLCFTDDVLVSAEHLYPLERN